jgi:hypothetical protein
MHSDSDDDSNNKVNRMPRMILFALGVPGIATTFPWACRKMLYLSLNSGILQMIDGL